MEVTVVHGVKGIPARECGPGTYVDTDNDVVVVTEKGLFVWLVGEGSGCFSEDVHGAEEYEPFREAHVRIEAQVAE